MNIRQIEVYITPDGLGRAAVIKRNDELLQIYVHWILSQAGHDSLNVARGGRVDWGNDNTPLQDLYKDIEPESGLYRDIEDARMAIKFIPGFSEATLKI